MNVTVCKWYGFFSALAAITRENFDKKPWIENGKDFAIHSSIWPSGAKGELRVSSWMAISNTNELNVLKWRHCLWKNLRNPTSNSSKFRKLQRGFMFLTLLINSESILFTGLCSSSLLMTFTWNNISDNFQKFSEILFTNSCIEFETIQFWSGQTANGTERRVQKQVIFL